MKGHSGFLEDIGHFYGRDQNIVIFEIGVSRSAFSTRALLQGLSKRKIKGTLYSVDIKDYSKSFDSSLKEHWVFILGDSRTIEWDKEIDVLLIDGHHSYEIVKADYEKYEPFVRPGGLILMHDVTNRRWGVKDFWKEIEYPRIILSLERAGLGIINKPK